jgi:hypothetical protein
MSDNENSSDSCPDRERRKKSRRLGKERRDQPRWETNSPIRRHSPGRRALDRLLNALLRLKE